MVWRVSLGTILSVGLLICRVVRHSVAPDGWANLEVRTVGLLPWLHLCGSVLVCAWLSQESLTSGYIKPWLLATEVQSQ